MSCTFFRGTTNDIYFIWQIRKVSHIWIKPMTLMRNFTFLSIVYPWNFQLSWTSFTFYGINGELVQILDWHTC
jgi:hypothetical protein